MRAITPISAPFSLASTASLFPLLRTKPKSVRQLFWCDLPQDLSGSATASGYGVILSDGHPPIT